VNSSGTKFFKISRIKLKSEINIFIKNKYINFKIDESVC
jgi:hypothetical protein